MYNTPILLIVFSRPNTTKEVFECIRQIQPTRLYIAADAPRKDRPDEIKRCEETRCIVSKVDWPCEVHTLFRDTNLGCKVAVSTAISWFFECEEYGVILEDDCLPDLSFFPFCEELLLKYKDDERIGHIGGNNFLRNDVKSEYSYDFCSVSHIWGWASWRRVWKDYDVNFPYWNEVRDDKYKRKGLFRNLKEEIYFSTFLSDVLGGNRGINTWDTQYFFMHRLQNRLSIYPMVNLVTNIGLHSIEATHTTARNDDLFVLSEEMKFPLKHPVYIKANVEIDDFTIAHQFFSYKRLVRYFLGMY